MLWKKKCRITIIYTFRKRRNKKKKEKKLATINVSIHSKVHDKKKGDKKLYVYYKYFYNSLSLSISHRQINWNPSQRIYDHNKKKSNWVSNSSTTVFLHLLYIVSKMEKVERQKK